MLNLMGFHDALNAILVIVIISVIIAVAWLSTNVREQPLIATAVVVFQSGVNGEGNRTSSVAESSQLDNQSRGTSGGDVETLLPAPHVKENESAVMEVKSSTGEVHANCGIAGVVDTDHKLLQKNNDTVLGNDLEGGPETELVHLGKDAAQCCDQESATDPSKDTVDSVELSSLSHPSLTGEPCNVSSQEMEIRNRRLKHFMTMGGSQITQSLHESSTSLDNIMDSSPKSKDEKTVLQKYKDQNENAESNTELSINDEDERPPGSIRIRLKFLDETQKFVFAQLTEQVGSFKRQHFSIEMDANRRIRLIFNGQLLSQDSSTLAQCGLFDNCVVHCHVSQPQQIGQNAGQPRDLAAQDDDDTYDTSLLAPLLYCVMVVMWYLRYEYSHLFNTMSTVILLFLTALLLISTYLLYITQNVPGSDGTAQISSHRQLETNGLL